MTSHSTPALFDQLITLIKSLPLPFKTSFLKEFIPLKEIYLHRRAPRICIIGDCIRPVVELFSGLGSGEFTTEPSENGWSKVTSLNKAEIFLFDARSHDQAGHLLPPLIEPSPDFVLVFSGATDFSHIARSEPLADFPGVPIFQLSTPSEHTKPRSTDLPLSLGEKEWQELLCASLPLAAQLEFARFFSAKRAQAYIASTLLKSFGTVSGAVGMQPIPLADLPILFSIQATMVALIIHTSGRPASIRLATEFLAALGVSAGVGFVFRETARVLLRFIPVWGNAISGLIAGTGTYAIGRASIAYFIDDSPLVESRRIFLSLMKAQKKPILKN